MRCFPLPREVYGWSDPRLLAAVEGVMTRTRSLPSVIAVAVLLAMLAGCGPMPEAYADDHPRNYPSRRRERRHTGHPRIHRADPRRAGRARRCRLANRTLLPDHVHRVDVGHAHRPWHTGRAAAGDTGRDAHGHPGSDARGPAARDIRLDSRSGLARPAATGTCAAWERIDHEAIAIGDRLYRPRTACRADRAGNAG